MTKEKLKQEAEKWLRKFLLCNDCKRKCHCIELNAYCEEQVLKAYIDSAEPREKRIEIDAKQIRALQKQNGELTDKVNDLEEKLFNADYQLEGRDLEIKELEAQIEQNKIDLAISEQDREHNDYELTEVYTKVEQLEKENAELKGIKDVATLIRANNDTVITLMQLNNKLVSKSQQLTKAKEIIKTFLGFAEAFGYSPSMDKFISEAEQFLNSEVEK